MGQHEDDERARCPEVDFDSWVLEDLSTNDNIQQCNG